MENGKIDTGVNPSIYIDKKVKLLIKDPVSPYPNNKLGVFVGFDEFNYYIRLNDNELPTGILRSTVLRIDPDE